MAISRVLRNIDVLFAESAAGIQISGDSGTGKSTVMELMMRRLANLGHGYLLLDPHGDLCRAMERYLSDQRESVRRRVYVIRPADTKTVVGMNPLFVPRDGIDAFTWNARVASKVSHVAHILIHCWGEQDFASKPVLAKFTSYYLETLARAGLTIPDVRHFFDVTSAVYHQLCRVAPDFIARLELSELAGMRPRDREDFIASTKNRFLGFLKNPIVDVVLARNGLDLRRLIYERAIVLVNLEKGDVLRDEDRDIFANLWLNELLFAVYQTPPAERLPFVVFIDELPVFQASAPQLAEALTQIRKFQLRCVAAHQGTQAFQDRTEDRLLHAMVGQCRVKLYFRHANPVDAKFFGEIVKLPTISAHRVKNILRTPTQYQDGHELMMLEDRSENWNEAEQSGRSDSTGTTESSSRGETSNTSSGRSASESRDEDFLRRCVTEARTASDNRGASSSQSSGRNQSTSLTWSSTRTQGGGRTLKQTLVPKFRLESIVSSIQYFTSEEQLLETASKIAGFKIGEAILSIAGEGASRVKFPLPANPLARTPRYAQRKLADLQQLVQRRPDYTAVTEALLERQEFLQRLVEYLQQLPEPHLLTNAAPKQLTQAEPETQDDDSPIRI